MNLRDAEPVDLSPRKLPALGLRPMKIILAEAAESSKGNPMIKVQVQLTSEEDDGYIIYDNFLTTNVKGAGFSVTKLRGLGINTDEEIEDVELAERLLNLEGYVDVKHEPIKDEDPRTGKYTIPRYEPDPVTGKNTLVKKAVAKGYSLHPTGGAPQTASAPQGAPPAPASWPQAPQGGFAPPAQRGPTSRQMQAQADAFPPAPTRAAPQAAMPPWTQQGGADAPPARPPPPQPVTGGAGGRGKKAK